VLQWCIKAKVTRKGTLRSISRGAGGETRLFDVELADAMVSPASSTASTVPAHSLQQPCWALHMQPEQCTVRHKCESRVLDGQSSTSPVTRRRDLMQEGPHLFKLLLSW